MELSTATWAVLQRCFTMISTFYLLKVTENYKNSFALLFWLKKEGELTHKNSLEMCGIAVVCRKNFCHDIKIASQLLSHKKRNSDKPPRSEHRSPWRRRKGAINEFNMRNFIIFM
jgi:hypothetical protein